MSKSSGEFLTVSLLEEKGYDPLVYRLFCLQSHYRKSLVFSYEGLDNAATTYQKLVQRIAALAPGDGKAADEAAARADGAPDVAERRQGITEEHRAVPADGEVEDPVVEGVHLRVGLHEARVRQVLAFGVPAGELDHVRGQVHAERRPVARAPRGVPGRLPAAAPDVEDVLRRFDRGGGEQVLVVAGDALVEPLGSLRPEGTLVAVPGAQLLGVRGVDVHRGALVHRVRSVPRSCTAEHTLDRVRCR